MNAYECQFELDEIDRNQLLKEAQAFDYNYHITENGYNPEDSIKARKLTSEEGIELPLSFLRGYPAEILNTEIIKKMTSLINSSLNFCSALYIHFGVNQGTMPHIDHNTNRKTIIAWALSPFIDLFSPITYYSDYKTVIETVYYTYNPLIFSTQSMHSVGFETKNNYDRYSFQLCFADPIEKLVELEQQGKLFVNV